ncbi:gluconokinase [Palleronia sediminis]|uniref:gluconokinase n=1 Tax=Palleronia sediminis TaxID=2547833 RepID=UPI001F0D67C0|nr:gluconokinase [Palleronia sediminis]
MADGPAAQANIVVMGVSGSGKSTIGEALAARLGRDYLDGDTLHPRANIDRMARGIALTDADRLPWLEQVGAALVPPGRVVACSALTRAYRDLIRARAGREVIFVYLRGRRETLARRMTRRTAHFMPVDLLDSQLATLQEPGPDERAVTVDIENGVDEIVTRAAREIADPG